VRPAPLFLLGQPGCGKLVDGMRLRFGLCRPGLSFRHGIRLRMTCCGSFHISFSLIVLRAKNFPLVTDLAVAVFQPARNGFPQFRQ